MSALLCMMHICLPPVEPLGTASPCTTNTLFFFLFCLSGFVNCSLGWAHNGAWARGRGWSRDLKNGPYSSITAPWQGWRIHKVACLLCCHSSWGTVHSGALARWTLLSTVPEKSFHSPFECLNFYISLGLCLGEQDIASHHLGFIRMICTTGAWEHWQAQLCYGCRAGTTFRWWTEVLFKSAQPAEELATRHSDHQLHPELCRMGRWEMGNSLLQFTSKHSFSSFKQISFSPAWLHVV